MLILKNQQEEDLKIIKTSWGNEFESIMDFLVMKTKIWPLNKYAQIQNKLKKKHLH